MNALRYALRNLYRWLQSHYFRYRVYSLHGILLPAGSEIMRPDAVKIGKRFSMGTSCRIYCHDPENGSAITIGDRVALNDSVMINADCGGKITIGNDVLIAPNVVLRASNHKYDRRDKPINVQGHAAGLINVADDVWIGANVVVLLNVSIGQGAIIGAGSVVTSDIPPYSIAAGIPAKVIGARGTVK